MSRQRGEGAFRAGVTRAEQRVLALTAQLQSIVEKEERARALDSLQSCLQAIATENVEGLAPFTNHTDSAVAKYAAEVMRIMEKPHPVVQPPAPTVPPKMQSTKKKEEVKKEEVKKKEEGILKGVLGIFSRKESDAKPMILPENQPKTYYDHKLKRYVIEGEQIEEEKVIPPPPMSSSKKQITKGQSKPKDEIDLLTAPPQFKRKSAKVKSKGLISDPIAVVPQITANQLLLQVRKEFQQLRSLQVFDSKLLQQLFSLREIQKQVAEKICQMQGQLASNTISLQLSQLYCTTQSLLRGSSAMRVLLNECIVLKNTLSLKQVQIMDLQSRLQAYVSESEMKQSQDALHRDQLVQQRQMKGTLVEKLQGYQCEVGVYRQKSLVLQLTNKQLVDKVCTLQQQLRECGSRCEWERGQVSRQRAVAENQMRVLSACAEETLSTVDFHAETTMEVERALQAEQQLLARVLEMRVEVGGWEHGVGVVPREERGESGVLELSETVSRIATAHLQIVKQYAVRCDKVRNKENLYEEKLNKLKRAMAEENVTQVKNIAKYRHIIQQQKHCIEECEERARKAELQWEKSKKKILHLKKDQEFNKTIMDRLKPVKQNNEVYKEEKEKMENRIRELEEEQNNYGEMIRQKQEEIILLLNQNQMIQKNLNEKQKKIELIREEIKNISEENQLEIEKIQKLNKIDLDEIIQKYDLLAEKYEKVQQQLTVKEKKIHEQYNTKKMNFERKIQKLQSEIKIKSQKIEQLQHKNMQNGKNEEKSEKEKTQLKKLIQQSNKSLQQIKSSERSKEKIYVNLKDELQKAQRTHTEQVSLLMEQQEQHERNIKKLKNQMDEYKKEEQLIKSSVERLINQLSTKILKANEESLKFIEQNNQYAELIQLMNQRNEQLQSQLRLTIEKHNKQMLKVKEQYLMQIQSLKKKSVQINQQSLIEDPIFKRQINHVIQKYELILLQKNAYYQNKIKQCQQLLLKQVSTQRQKSNQMEELLLSMEKEHNQQLLLIKKDIQQKQQNQKVYKMKQSQLDDKITALDMKNKQIQIQYSQLLARNTQEQSKHQKQELQNLKRKCEQLQQLSIELQRNIQQMQKEKQILKNQIQKKDRQIKQLAQRNRRQVGLLKKEVSEKCNKLEQQLLESRQNLLEANSLFNEKDKESQQKIQELQKQIISFEQTKGTIKKLQQKIKQLQNQNNDLLNQKAQLMRHNDKLMTQKQEKVIFEPTSQILKKNVSPKNVLQKEQKGFFGSLSSLFLTQTQKKQINK